VRERGTVLIVLASRPRLWPLPGDLSFDITNAQWASRRDSTRVISPVRMADAAKQFARVRTWMVLPNRRGRCEAN